MKEGMENLPQKRNGEKEKEDTQSKSSQRNKILATAFIALFNQNIQAQEFQKSSLAVKSTTEAEYQKQINFNGIHENQYTHSLLGTEDDYRTLDGNVRHFHNPSGERYTEDSSQSVLYAHGAIESPYTDLEEMKAKTKTPESLTETDFFTNYVNAINETKTILTDKNTGNPYLNFNQYDSTIADGVRFEGEKHWNIIRFLIEPHYADFNVPKKQARINALYDMYRYFLYQEKGNRDVAWKEANAFLEKEVDPIVNSKYAAWVNENYPKLGVTSDTSNLDYFKLGEPNLYSKDDHTNFVNVILNYNKKILDAEKKDKLYSQEEIEDILTDYNMVYRKKDAETARKIAHQSVIDAENKNRKEEEEIRNMPLAEYKVLQKGEYPPDFDTWDVLTQNQWTDSHPDKIEKIQKAFTEKDRQEDLDYYKNLRFVSGSVKKEEKKDGIDHSYFKKQSENYPRLKEVYKIVHKDSMATYLFDHYEDDSGQMIDPTVQK